MADAGQNAWESYNSWSHVANTFQDDLLLVYSADCGLKAKLPCKLGNKVWHCQRANYDIEGLPDRTVMDFMFFVFCSYLQLC